MSTVACSERDQIMRSRGKCSASSASRAPSEFPLMSSASSDGDWCRGQMVGAHARSSLKPICDVTRC